MARRSSIARDPKIRAAVDAALLRGLTIDQIVDQLGGPDSPVSRSAIGRYSKDYVELAAQQRDMRAVASAFAADVGGEDDLQGRMMIQLMTSVITRAIMPIATGEEIALDPKAIADIAKAVKDVTGASKIDVEREVKIRAEAAKRATAKAAEVAEGAARATGASAETIRRVRADILGLSS